MSKKEKDQQITQIYTRPTQYFLRAYFVPNMTKHFILVKPPQQPYEKNCPTTFSPKLRFMGRLNRWGYTQHVESWGHVLIPGYLSCSAFSAKDFNCFLQEICKQNATGFRLIKLQLQRQCDIDAGIGKPSKQNRETKNRATHV